ncbi:MAG: CRTAC1 family protein, partial [Candidatus Sulfotelmatobacter sp.]
MKSLSRSALVLQLDSVLALARPRWLWPSSQADQKAEPAKSPSPPSDDPGVSFFNVARESGLNVKTIFGGEHKNKYLLETT